MINFVDRDRELATLKKEYETKDASFVVLYGRRRVGKTALINHFCKNKESIYFICGTGIFIAERSFGNKKLFFYFKNNCGRKP